MKVEMLNDSPEVESEVARLFLQPQQDTGDSDGMPTDYSSKSTAGESSSSDANAEIENDLIDQPLDTMAIFDQVRSVLKSLNLPQRHLLSVVNCAEGTLSQTLQKANVPWTLLHPSNRKAYHALANWLKKCQEKPPGSQESQSTTTSSSSSVGEPMMKTELSNSTNDLNLAEPDRVRKKRGRKPKNSLTTTTVIEETTTTTTTTLPRLSHRGRQLVERNVFSHHHQQQSTSFVGVKKTESDFVGKRKRGRPPKARPSSRTERYSGSKQAFVDGVPNVDDVEYLNVKLLSQSVRENLLALKMSQEALANQIGIVMPTLNRIINDASWLPWSETNKFRRAVFMKLVNWLNEVNNLNSEMIDDFTTESSSNSRVVSPAADLPSTATSPRRAGENEDDESRPSSSTRAVFLSPSSSVASERAFEAIDSIPPTATCPAYSKIDRRDGKLVWPMPVDGFVGLSARHHSINGVVLVDELVSIGRGLLTDARLTLVSGRHYGLCGPAQCGKSALLRLLYKKRMSYVIGSNGADVAMYYSIQQQVSQRDSPTTAGEVRAIEYVRQAKHSTNVDANLFGEPYLQGHCKTEEEKSEIWCGLLEKKARLILSGLGISFELQNSYIKDINPRLRPRLVLARTIFAEPRLLLLDEPTTSLDIDAVLFLQSYLKTFRHTLLMVTNCPSLLDQVCTDVIRIENETLKYFSAFYRPYSSYNANI